MWVPLPSAFVFFHSHIILPLLHRILLLHVLGNVCLLWHEECVGFWACITFFVLSWNGHCLEKGLCLYSLLGSYSYHSSSFPWACWPCWPIVLTTSFLGLLRPTYLIFTSYSSHGHVGCYSCHVGPFGLLPLFLGFLDSLTSSLSLVLPMLTSSLPLILPMGLLAVILAMLVHWACYLFSWLTYFIFTFYSSHGLVGC